MGKIIIEMDTLKGVMEAMAAPGSDFETAKMLVKNIESYPNEEIRLLKVEILNHQQHLLDVASKLSHAMMTNIFVGRSGLVNDPIMEIASEIVRTVKPGIAS